MYQAAPWMLFYHRRCDHAERGASMKRSEALWSRDTARNTTAAILVDADGREWTASIKQEPFGSRFRLVTTLMCPAEGRLFTTSLPSNVEAAKAWCYEKLQLE